MVFTRELLEKAGAEERSEFDGAQDYDLTLRLEGGMHEVTNGFWSCENRHVMQPLYKANKQYESLTREYLSNIHIDELDSPALSARNRAK